MHIAMIGSGYVGLVSGACLADFGHHVVCVDKDPEKISALNRGQSTIFEPGLDDLIASNTRDRRLSFTSHLAPPVPNSEAHYLPISLP
jgi:UDPglucose 6-dehydrogenase